MPLYSNAVLENTLGTIGAVFWSVQLLPQIIKSYRRKDTAGLSATMLAIWLLSAVFLGAYVIVQNISIPLIVQPQCFMFLSAISWAQCLYYNGGWKKSTSIIFAIVVLVAAGGLEAAFVFSAKAAESAGKHQVTTTWGILAVVFIVGGLIPQYVEIFRYRAVIGISLIFLFVDLLGGFFSMLSLLFAEGPFDILAAVSYGAVAALELGVFALVPILNPPYHRRLAAQSKADEEALAGEANSDDGRADTIATCVPSVVGRDEGTPKASEETEGQEKGKEVVEEHHKPLGWMELDH